MTTPVVPNADQALSKIPRLKPDGSGYDWREFDRWLIVIQRLLGPYENGAPRVNVFTAAQGAHNRQHSIIDPLDHTSTATPGKVLKADADGLPIDATNTDAEVALAVIASHARLHSIISALDHTGTVSDSGYLMKANAAGLPVKATNTDTEAASAVSSKHTQGTDQGLDTGGTNAVTAANLRTLLNNTSNTNTGDQTLSGLGAEAVANKSTNIVTDGTSNTKYPGVKAIKDYADGLVVGLLDDRGNYDASGNAWPTTGGSGAAGAILKGDLWYISVAGTLGGVSATVGSSIRALVDSPGSTAANWDILNVGIGYTPENVANRRTTFQATPDDTHYPTEKLVKDSLDAKVSTTMSTQNPPLDADLFIYRASAAAWALVTSTGTQIKAFLKTYFDTIYDALGLASTVQSNLNVVANPKAMAQSVALQAGAIAAIKTTHSAVFSNTTNSFGIGGIFALPLWTPAANQTLRNKWAANVGYKLEVVLTSGAFVLYLNDTVYTSAVPGGGAVSSLVADTAHSILAIPTVGATTTTVSFFLDGVLLSTTAAQTNEDVTTTGDMYTGGTSAATFAMTVYDTYDYNRALSVPQVLSLYRNGIDFADKGGSQTELIVGTLVLTNGSGWDAIVGVTFGVGGATFAANSDRMLETALPLLTIGKRYRATVVISSSNATLQIDNAPTVYLTTSAIGTVSVEFTFTGAGSFFRLSQVGVGGIVVASLSLVEIGYTLALEPESWQPDKPYDLSTNNNVCSYPATGWSLTRPNSKKLWQPTPTAETTAVTLTIAKLLTGIITATHTAGATQAYELPTGTLCDAWPVFGIDRCCEWSLINLSAAAADTVTVTAHDNHTFVGNPIVQSAHATTGGIYGNSAMFRTRKTAANVFVTYRIG